MGRTFLLRLAFLISLQPVLAFGADHWGQIKAGMSSAETTKLLGEPLFRNHGKGFELWIYDLGAEVVFYGGVIAWTAPAGSKVAASASECWSFFQAGPEEIVIPFPKARNFLPIPQIALADIGSATTFRYKQK